jgi:N-methylhydantoinase A
MKGKLRLDIQAAKAVVTELIAKPLGYFGDLAAEKAAQGILDIATVTMAGAIKEITIERGIDARDFKLFVFGGGGPLFGSVLARALGIRHVVVPPHPGNFSTLGMLIAGARMDLARTFLTLATPNAQPHINRIFAELETEGRLGLQRDLGERAIDFEYSLEARYLGQTHTVRVAYDKDEGIEVFLADFERTYQKRFGHANADCEVEVLALKLGATAEIPKPDLLQCVQLPVGQPPAHKEVRNVYFAQPHGWLSVPVWQRELLPVGFDIAGPAIIEEFSSTTVLMPGDKAQVGAYGEINLEVCDV